MKMRARVARLMVMALVVATMAAPMSVMTSVTAWAVSPVGSWVIDRPAWEVEMKKAIDRLTPVVPPEQLALLKQAGMDPEKLVKQGIGDMSKAQLDLTPDGKALAQNFRNKSYSGTWSTTDDGIVLSFPQDKARMFGRLEGERLVLRADPTTLKPQARAMVGDLKFPLLRR